MIDLNSGSQPSEMSTIVNKLTQVSRIALWWSSLNVFVFVIVSFFGQVLSPHHSDQMSQRSQVSGIALWGCSLNVFVFVIVFVFVFVFVFVIVFLFGQVMSPYHSDQYFPSRLGNLTRSHPTPSNSSCSWKTWFMDSWTDWTITMQHRNPGDNRIDLRVCSCEIGRCKTPVILPWTVVVPQTLLGFGARLSVGSVPLQKALLQNRFTQQLHCMLS